MPVSEEVGSCFPSLCLAEAHRKPEERGHWGGRDRKTGREIEKAIRTERFMDGIDRGRGQRGGKETGKDAQNEPFNIVLFFSLLKTGGQLCKN